MERFWLREILHLPVLWDSGPHTPWSLVSYYTCFSVPLNHALHRGQDSKPLGAKLIRLTTDLTHCCCLIHLPPSRAFCYFTEKTLSYLQYQNITTKRIFPCLFLSGISASLTITLRKKLQSQSKFHKFIPFAELLILGVLLVLSKFLESWWNWTLLCNKVQYVKNDISIHWLESYSFQTINVF